MSESGETEGSKYHPLYLCSEVAEASAAPLYKAIQGSFLGCNFRTPYSISFYLRVFSEATDYRRLLGQMKRAVALDA